jgi:hypothetical protein
LPALVETYRILANFRPFGQARAVTLTGLNGLVPIAMAALRPHSSRGKRTADWHDAAALIADRAKEAWGATGRTQFGTNPTSPVVNFVHLFLERAGIEKDNAAIAKALIGSDRLDDKPQNKKKNRRTS